MRRIERKTPYKMRGQRVGMLEGSREDRRLLRMREMERKAPYKMRG